ncbi:RDD family protein [Streptomyces sp. NPDC093598]|uniref:RDD family protein n=1 Tax=Streptomyces sp. NPDC093598 TaxID=3366046 RepID=UPI003807105E
MTFTPVTAPVPPRPAAPPAPAPPRPGTLRRTLAWTADFALILLFAWLLGGLTLRRVLAHVAEAADLVQSNGWDLLTSPGNALDRTEHLLGTMWHEIAVLVIQALALLVAGTFLYHWVSLALFRRTPGKMLAGLEVVPCTRSAAAVRAAVSTTADVACFALACCLLVFGAFAAAFTVWLLSVIVFWSNVLPALTDSGRSMADRLAGTTVVRRLRP